ncbi:hypothetical protein AHF37_12757, partial [Paragonimus kellicotti]
EDIPFILRSCTYTFRLNLPLFQSIPIYLARASQSMSSLELLVQSMVEYLDPTTSSRLNGLLELERGELDRVRHLAQYHVENAKTMLASLSNPQHPQSGADSFKRVCSIYLHHNYKVGLSPEDVRA